MSHEKIQTNKKVEFLNTLRIQVATDLKIFISLQDKAPDAVLINELNKIDFPFCLTITPDSEFDSILLLQNALAEIKNTNDTHQIDILDEEYKSIYSNQSISSILVDAEGTGNKQHVCMYSFFEVLNWYKKFNLGIPDWHMHPNDHLVYELQYLISLLYHDNNPDALEHIAIFLDEHLLLWLGSFSKQIRDNSKAPFYTGIISLTAAYCEELRDIIAELLEQPRPTRKEIEQRMKFGHEKTKEITIQFVPSITPAI